MLQGYRVPAMRARAEGEADLVKDKRIAISELQMYVASRVKMLTEDRLHIPMMRDFDPDTVVGYVK